MKKVVIVDDEAPARSLLKEYLADYPSLVIVGECNNGVDAVRTIETFQPEIVFLDIQMPGMTGFDVLRQLDTMPQIIFSTAYDQYALEAFEVHALDYLLKPYTKERFSRAIQRLEQTTGPDLLKLKTLAESLTQSGQNNYPTKIFVQAGNKLSAVNTTDIIWINAEKDYSRLITAQAAHLSNYGIGQLEQKLDPQVFIRVHRSAIINLHFVSEIHKYPSSYDLRMSNGDVVRVSRSYLDNIRRLTF